MAMTNKDLIIALLELPMDSQVFTWGERGFNEVTAPTSSDALPEWRQQEANLPSGSIVIPV